MFNTLMIINWFTLNYNIPSHSDLSANVDEDPQKQVFQRYNPQGDCTLVL